MVATNWKSVVKGVAPVEEREAGSGLRMEAELGVLPGRGT
jgi:hypothetical protein